MSLGESGGAELEFETLHGRGWPTVTQFSVFLENRVGQLLEVFRVFNGSKVRIVGFSISDAADCCILRMMVNRCEQAREILRMNSLPFAENELIVAEIPSGPHSLVELCTALLQAEINIHYSYPLIVHPLGRAAIALHVDNNEQAGATLHQKGFDIISEADLSA